MEIQLLNFKYMSGGRVKDKLTGLVFNLWIAFSALLFYSCVNLEELPSTAGPMLIISPSQNYGAFPMVVSFVIEAIPSRGSIKNLVIDYGDGSQENVKDRLKDNKVVLTKTYESLGIFYVKLYGMDDSGASETSTVIITNDAPKIEAFRSYKDSDFSEPTSDFVPGDVVYVKALCTDMNGLSHVIFLWGDGEHTRTDKCEASHRYSVRGDYNVTIIVYDANKFAPYPFSSSQTIRISVFEGAGSAENFEPFVHLTYEYVKGGERSYFGVMGVAPLEVGIIVGVADLDSGLRSVFVDWGDGYASPVVLDKPLAKSGQRYIFRLSHEYKREGKFFITVIAYDNLGKIKTAQFGPIFVFSHSPAIFVEATDISGVDINNKDFSSPLTVKLKIVSFDVVGPYSIYLDLEHSQAVIGKRERYIKVIDSAENISLKEIMYTLESPGNYVLRIYALPQDDLLVGCIYCTDHSEHLNRDLRCENVHYTSLSPCEISAGNLKKAQIGAEKVFSFSVVQR